MTRRRSGLNMFNFSPYATGQAGKRDLLRGNPMENLFGTPSNDPWAASSVAEPDLLVFNDDPTRPGGELYRPPAPEYRHDSGLSLGAGGNNSSIGSRARRSLSEQDEGLLSLLMSNRLFGGRR